MAAPAGIPSFALVLLVVASRLWASIVQKSHRHFPVSFRLEVALAIVLDGDAVVPCFPEVFAK